MLFNNDVILGSEGLEIKSYSRGVNRKNIEFSPFAYNDFSLTLTETKKERKLISELKLETDECFAQDLKNDELNVVNIFFKNVKKINYSIENKKIVLTVFGDLKHSIDKMNYCYDIGLQSKLESKNKPLVGKFLLENYLHIIKFDEDYSDLLEYVNENRTATEEDIIDFITQNYIKDEEVSLSELISVIESYKNTPPDDTVLNDFNDESKKTRTTNVSNCIQFLKMLNCKENLLFKSKLKMNNEVFLCWRNVKEGSFIILQFIEKDAYSCFVNNKECEFFKYDCPLDYIPKELNDFINNQK